MERQFEIRERSPVVSANGEKPGEVERAVVEPGGARVDPHRPVRAGIAVTKSAPA
jgi:hypothetical protein